MEPIGFSSGIVVLWNVMDADVSMVHKTDLCMNLVVQRFTWTNCGRRNPIIERLDRSWINQLWLDAHPDSHLKHLPRLSSDHYPILLSTSIPTNSCPRRFKFMSQWLLEPSFLPFASLDWSKLPGLIPSKHDNLSSHLSTRAKETVGCNVAKKRGLPARIDGIQRKTSRVISLNDDVGNAISNPRDLENHILSLYQSLYRFDKPFTERLYIYPIPLICYSSIRDEEDILCALFSLGANKAPGPDMFHAGFFKACWDLVKIDLIPLIQFIFSDKTIPLKNQLHHHLPHLQMSEPEIHQTIETNYSL
ncbi:uncharacterized protein LOC141630442 [Silene latifolia]|uniref:uncharacterized protein LOC141630442 n=1 Tax=Silene latifolia TaxID=37657 RepID=UPI003D787BEB